MFLLLAGESLTVFCSAVFLINVEQMVSKHMETNSVLSKAFHSHYSWRVFWTVCVCVCVCVCVWGELKDSLTHTHTLFLSLWPILHSGYLCILSASFSAPDSRFTEKQSLTDPADATRLCVCSCVFIRVCLLPQALCLFMLNTNSSQVLQTLRTAHLLTSHTHLKHTHTHTLTSNTHTHTHLKHTHTHTFVFWFMGTLHRRNGFYTVQSVCAIALHLPYT